MFSVQNSTWTGSANGVRGRRLVNIVLVLTILYLLFVNRSSSARGYKFFEVGSRGSRLAASEKAQRLDGQYLTRLIASAGNPAAKFRAILSGDEVKRSNITASVVSGRMKDEPERLQWMYDRLIDIQDIHVYIVDDPDSELPHLAKNHGREANIYLSYIIEHYDKLPDVVFFWHGDEVVWHNNLLMDWNSTISINRMDRENILRQGYVPSRCDLWPGCPNWIRFNPSRAEQRLDPHRLEELFSTETFRAMFPDAEDFPSFFAGTCCSQFAVSRDAIRRHPLDFYIHLRNWTIDENNDDSRSGRVFEYTWPYIFLGRGTYCPTMQECYCRTYNFCMEEGKTLSQLERWNALRTRREEVQWQLAFMENAMVVKHNSSRERGASDAELMRIEAAFRPELDRLQENLGNLSDKAWEAREEVIHYWKLGVPPVGW